MNKGLLIFIFLVALIFCFLFVGNVKQSENITWGVNYSQKQVEALDLEKKEVYLAILDNLKADHIKIAVHWDLIEPKKGEFDFSFLDWQMEEAKKRDAQILLAIGMKTPRWPEAHIPSWAKELEKKIQQEYILKMENKIILRYKDFSNLEGWQIENEPLFKYGDVPWVDENFLEKEIKEAKKIDSNHLVITTDSGEGSFWFPVAKLADEIGITMYRKVWFTELKNYFTYPIPPTFYGRKAELIEKVFHKKVICVELQAEPWCGSLTKNCALEEQSKTMDLEKFKENIDFAKKTGLDTFYLWGTEWWYSRLINGDPQIWEQAKKLWN